MSDKISILMNHISSNLCRRFGEQAKKSVAIFSASGNILKSYSSIKNYFKGLIIIISLLYNY